MSKKRKTYNTRSIFSAVFMIAALAWLTVSAPFVYASQQAVVKQQKAYSNLAIGSSEEESPNPLTNSPEEKKPGGTNSFAEEFLHDTHADGLSSIIDTQYHRGKNADTYTAFHGELLVPPPNYA